jgi:hypothetical protein
MATSSCEGAEKKGGERRTVYHVVQSNMTVYIFQHFCLFEMVRSAKIFISTARGSTSGGTRSFVRKNLLKHCIQLVRKHEGLILTRSLEYCFFNIKRSKIPRSLLCTAFFENIANFRNLVVFCADCKVNCQTQPITVELTTLTNLNAAIPCT